MTQIKQNPNLFPKGITKAGMQNQNDRIKGLVTYFKTEKNFPKFSNNESYQIEKERSIKFLNNLGYALLTIGAIDSFQSVKEQDRGTTSPNMRTCLKNLKEGLRKFQSNQNSRLPKESPDRIVYGDNNKTPTLYNQFGAKSCNAVVKSLNNLKNVIK